jgi:hypothetical protein
MKKLLSILFVLIAFTASAQIRYPAGSATFRTIAVNNDTLVVTGAFNAVNYYDASADTLIANTLFQASNNSGLKAGDLLYLKVKSGNLARTVSFASAQFTCPNQTNTAGKTILYRFVYTGSKWEFLGTSTLN